MKLYIYIYILLIIEHNGDVTLEKKTFRPLCLYHIYSKQADQQPSEVWQTVHWIPNIYIYIYIYIYPIYSRNSRTFFNQNFVSKFRVRDL